MRNRQSIRMDGYDYSESGYYFVTVDTQNKLKLFWGENEKLQKGGHIGPPVHGINQIGNMIEYWWNEIPNHFKYAKLDNYVLMPDHFHGIIYINNIVGADRCVRPLGTIIQWFKTITTNEYIKNVKNNNWPRFNRRLWQRNYYERIIRNEFELNRVRKYILENPIKWKK